MAEKLEPKLHLKMARLSLFRRLRRMVRRVPSLSGIYLTVFTWCPKKWRYRFLVPIADWDNVPRDNVPM